MQLQSRGRQADRQIDASDSVSHLDGLQSVPREPNDKDAVVMLDELTIEANEEPFVIVLQYGGNGVT